MSSKKHVPVRAGRARAEDAGPPSGPLGPPTRPTEARRAPPGSEGCTSGETHVCQPSQGKGKIGLFLLTCAVSRRMFRSKKKQRCEVDLLGRARIKILLARINLAKMFCDCFFL